MAFGYVRVLEGHRLIVLANFSDERQELPGNKLRTAGLGRFFQDAISESTYSTSEPLALSPYQIVWLLRV